MDFEKQIQPIFEANCIKCHGPAQQKSGLRVDRRAVMLKGGDYGVAAITSGDPKKSYLLDLIKDSDPDTRMPPKSDPLTAEQISLLELWIAEGAV